jgi:hypothetical protein
MSDTSTYNGFANRETWLISLWLNNDQESYELLSNVLGLSTSSTRKAEKLHNLVEDQMYDLELEASLWSDLLSTALAMVDWLEVIESNLE